MPENNYLNYGPEEFAGDVFFIRWVQAAEMDTETFWQNWLETYPFKRKDVETARQLVLTTGQLPVPKVTPAEIRTMKETVFRRIDEGEERPVKQLWRRYWRVAVVVFLAVSGWYTVRYGEQQPAPQENTDSGMRVVTNTGAKPQSVNLPDGSSVILEPESSLRYPVVFEKKKREVFLDGEAFFEVIKNPEQPFLVHAHEIVTRVLGTSFSVRAFPRDANIRVRVKTGKVSLLSKNVTDRGGARPDADLVLEANQQAEYDKKGKTLRFIPGPEREEPSPGPPIMDILFEYDETPVSKVFADLEKAYHLKIVYDHTVIGDCPVTAYFGDEPLQEKLRLISKAIRAGYELNGNEVRIHGKGCM